MDLNVSHEEINGNRNAKTRIRRMIDCKNTPILKKLETKVKEEYSGIGELGILQGIYQNTSYNPQNMIFAQTIKESRQFQYSTEYNDTSRYDYKSVIDHQHKKRHVNAFFENEFHEYTNTPSDEFI